MRTVNMVALAVLAASGFAQTAPSIYSAGRSTESQGILLRGWGSGTIKEVDDTAFEGTTSIRVSSRNFFQGGILNLSKPVDLSGAFSDKNNLIVIALRVPTSGELANSSGGGGAPGAAGAGEMGAPGGGGQEGREGGAGGGAGAGTLGRGGGGGQANTASSAPEEISQIRVLITTTDGKRSEIYLPVKTSRPNPKGWRTIGVPLQAITGLERTNKIIQSVAFSSDVVGSFYVGEVRTMNDSTPIYGETNFRETNVGSGSTLTFSATGFGGSSVLKYTWDFDSTNGIEVDAEGQSVKRRFRKPGTYTVTLTISDVYGLKAPFTTTVKVTVN